MPTETYWQGVAGGSFCKWGQGYCEALPLEIDPLFQVKRESCSRVEASRKVSGQRPSGREKGFLEMK